MADKKRNNASWCCDRIEELIEEYKKRSYESYDIDSERTAKVYRRVAKELEEILYGN